MAPAVYRPKVAAQLQPRQETAVPPVSAYKQQIQRQPTLGAPFGGVFDMNLHGRGANLKINAQSPHSQRMAGAQPVQPRMVGSLTDHSQSTQPTVAQLHRAAPYLPGHAVVQRYCATCKAIDNKELEHSVKNCPYYVEDTSDSEDEKKEEKKVEEPKKLQGWQKGGNQTVKMGKGERDKRKRKGHGMMSKEQARRYVSNY